MHEIDVGVGLQKIAPGALARMRLARDEQHAQLLADALDRDDGLVVDRRQLVRRAASASISTTFGPPWSMRTGSAGPAPGARGVSHEAAPSRRTVTRRGLGAAALHRPARGSSGPCRRCRSAAPRRARCAGRARSGRPVMSACSGALKPSALGIGGDVVDDAVRDHDDAGEPLRRHVGEARSRAPRRAGCRRSPVAVVGLDDARLDVGERAEAPLQLGRVTASVCAARSPSGLRGRAVDDDRDDVLHLLASSSTTSAGLASARRTSQGRARAGWRPRPREDEREERQQPRAPPQARRARAAARAARS